MGALAGLDMNPRGYAEKANLAEYQQPSIRKRLEIQRQNYQFALDKVNAAIEALDSNPNLEQFMEVIRATGL